MLKRFIYGYLMKDRVAKLLEMKTSRSRFVGREQIEKYQIDKFNEVWDVARKNVPFYQNWQKCYCLPSEIKCLAELRDWPILTKSDLRKLEMFNRKDIPRPTGMRVTGGSTGEPVRIPSWPDQYSAVSQLLGRERYGVELGGRTFLLWGHRHLYGKGFLRQIEIAKRGIKDWLADWKRFSAYDLSHAAMQKAYMSLVRYRPKYVIGFSTAVLALVRQNADKIGTVDFVETVICSAGPLLPRERQEIELFFNCKVCMEYGSIDCGVMAYTRPADDKYEVFWNTHLLQAKRDEKGEFRSLVTRLTSQYLPMIRYDICDYLDLQDEDIASDARSVLVFNSVKGRPTGMVTFKSGASFWAALIDACVKQVPEILSAQAAVDVDNNKLVIRVTSNVNVSDDKLFLIKNRFMLSVPSAETIDVSVVQVEQLEVTIGGKILMVVALKN